MASDPQLKRIYELIGEIATSWSVAELLWYLIFTALMKETPRAQVDAIFFLFETSAKQRDLILAVADVVYPDDKSGRPDPKRRRLGQLNAATQGAAGARNAAIHAVINAPQTLAQALQGHYRVAPGPNPRRPNKLAGKKLDEELTKALAQLSQLIEDLEGFRAAISPKLQLRQDIAEELRKLGFQVPSWIEETPTPPTDPTANS